MAKKRMSGKAKAGIALGCVVVVLFAATVYLKMPGESAAAQLEPFTKAPIAHRGYFDNEGPAPENSLPAFQRAIEHGYCIEIDTQLTADGTVIVLHDKSLLRSSGVDRNVEDMTDAELAECRLFGTDEHVPTLAEVLALINGQVPLLVEIKGEAGDDVAAISAATYEQLKSYSGTYVVQSFNPFALQWFKDNAPDVPRGILSKDFIADPEGQSIVNRAALTPMLTNVLARPNFISYEFKSAGQPTFSAMKALSGLPCLAWTLKSQEELDGARAAGFDGFIFDSFEPDAAASALQASDVSASPSQGSETAQGVSSGSASSASANAAASGAAFTGVAQGSANTGKEDTMFGQLKSVVYSESGDMLGSLYSVEAERTGSGVTVTVRTSKMHSDPIEVSEYRGDDNLLDQVEAIIDGAGMKEWGKLPQSEFIALDAATKSLRAQFDSADPNDAWPEWLSYSFNDQLPDNGESIRQIYDLMVANTGEDRLIRTYVEEPR